MGTGFGSNMNNITLSIVDGRGDLAADNFIKLLLSFILLKKYRILQERVAVNLNKWALGSKGFAERSEINFNSILKLVTDVSQKVPYLELTEPLNKLIRLLDAKKSVFDVDPLLYPPQPKFINSCVQWLLNGSPAAYRYVESLVETVNEPVLTSLFTPLKRTSTDAYEHTNKERELVALIKKATGKKVPAYNLDDEQRRALKEQDAEEYQRFLDLRSDLIDKYKKVLEIYIRHSGKPYLPVSDVLQHLKQLDIHVHRVPDGLDPRFNIASDGSIWTSGDADHDPEKIDGVPNGAVEMNPKWVPGSTVYVFKTVIVPGKEYNDLGQKLSATPYYTLNAKRSNREERFENITSLVDEIPGIVAKFRADLNSTGLKKVAATIASIMYTCGMRVGNPKAATKGVTTYGITTLEVRHVEHKGNVLDIKYVGKSGSPQEYVFNGTDRYARKTISNVVEMLKGKEEHEKVFTFDKNGVNVDITNIQFNAYLKAIASGTGVKLTAKNFRTLLGTSIAAEHVAKQEKIAGGDLKTYEMSQRDAEKWWDESIAINVGRALGHHVRRGENGEPTITATTANTNYINPSFTRDVFLDKLGLREPKWLAKLLSAPETDSDE